MEQSYLEATPGRARRFQSKRCPGGSKPAPGRSVTARWQEQCHQELLILANFGELCSRNLVGGTIIPGFQSNATRIQVSARDSCSLSNSCWAQKCHKKLLIQLSTFRKIYSRKAVGGGIIPGGHSWPYTKISDRAMSTRFQVSAKDSCSLGDRCWARNSAVRITWSSSWTSPPSARSWMRKTVIWGRGNYSMNRMTQGFSQRKR